MILKSLKIRNKLQNHKFKLWEQIYKKIHINLKISNKYKILVLKLYAIMNYKIKSLKINKISKNHKLKRWGQVYNKINTRIFLLLINKSKSIR